MKTCIRCGVPKTKGSFYALPGMSDGLASACKECTKAGVRANRKKNIDRYRAYEKARYRDQPKRRARVSLACKIFREKYPEKYAARTAVSNALRDGKLKRLPCEVCGNKRSEGHHDDYSKRLEVRWLCRLHHLEQHGGRFNEAFV